MNTSPRLIGALLCAISIITVTPMAASSPRPDAPSAAPETITTLGPGEGPLEAGTYRTEEINGGGVGVPPIILTLPAGWSSIDGWVLHRGSLEVPTVAVQFWDVGEIYGHPCDWRGTLLDPGPSVDDLAAALVDRPMRNATQPTAVTIDGREGLYLEWSVPADLDFTDCDADGGEHYFESWVGASDGDRYHQGPGQLDRLWILDVDGARLVIDGFDMPSATDAERQELLDVVASIRFEEPAPSGAPGAPSASP
jgi:hypothetical protein